jgi:hypothetical protein
MRPEKLIHEKTYVKKSSNRVPIERGAQHLKCMKLILTLFADPITFSL